MPHRFNSIGDAFRAVPATFFFLFASLAGFLLVQLVEFAGAPLSIIALFTFTDFQAQAGDIASLSAEGQYWRWLTPIFLHFSWLHLIFNGLWLWEFGALIERRCGSLRLCLLVLVCGAASNWAQYWWSGPSLFGGMSGVVYALLAYCLVIERVIPGSGLALPRGIAVLLLAWLLLCMTGIFDFFGIAIANAAHLAGLLSGGAAALIALATGAWRKPGRLDLH